MRTTMRKLLVLVALVTLLPSLSLAAPLNFVGFETGDERETTEGGNSFTNASLTNPRTGLWSLQVNPTTTNVGSDELGCYTAVGQGGVGGSCNIPTVYIRTYFRYATKAATGEEDILAFYRHPDATRKGYVTLNAAGNLKLYDSANTQVGSTGAITLVANTYYRIEVLVPTGVAATASVRVNGTTDISGTGNFLVDNFRAVAFGKYSNRGGNTVDYFYDDIAIDDAAYPDAGAVVMLPPNLNGAVQDWTVGTNAANYLEVDDSPTAATDNDTTYVEKSAAASQMALFYVQSTVNAGIPAGSVVKAVKSYGRFRSTAGTASTAVRLRSGGVDSDTTASAITTSYFSFWKFLTTDPNTSAAWTLAAVDDIQVGAIDTAAISTVRATGFGVMVSYVPAALPANTQYLNAACTNDGDGSGAGCAGAAAGPGAFKFLATWENQNLNLVAANTALHTLQCASQSPINQSKTFDGWTLDSTHRVRIKDCIFVGDQYDPFLTIVNGPVDFTNVSALKNGTGLKRAKSFDFYPTWYGVLDGMTVQDSGAWTNDGAVTLSTASVYIGADNTGGGERVIRNAVIHHSKYHGLSISTGPNANLSVDNNTVANAALTGIRVEVDTGAISSTVRLRNNLATSNAGGDYVLGTTWNTYINAANVSSDASSVNVPFRSKTISYTNAAAGEYDLVAGETDAINAGVDLSATFTVDRNFDIRPSGSGFEIGAYEFYEAPTPTPTPTPVPTATPTPTPTPVPTATPTGTPTATPTPTPFPTAVPTATPSPVPTATPVPPYACPQSGFRTQDFIQFGGKCVITLAVADTRNCQGFVGLSSASTGLKISLRPNSLPVPFIYSVAGNTIQPVPVLGTYTPPTAGKVRIREVNALYQQGVYEIQADKSICRTNGSNEIDVCVSGAANIPNSVCSKVYLYQQTGHCPGSGC